MKPWQAAKLALESGAPLNESEDDREDFLFLEDEEIHLATSSRGQKLICLNFPYTYADEVARFDGEIHCQEHRPNPRVVNSPATGDTDLQIVQIDEAIMWSLYKLEDELCRLYLLRDIRNELYYFNNSEEG